GRRECRALDAPQPRVEKNRTTRASSLRSHRKRPAFPAQWFTTYIALSPVIGLFVTVAGETLLAHLTPASRHQDHTTSPSASDAVRPQHIRVHRIPLRAS